MKRCSFDITLLPSHRVWRVGCWAHVGSAARLLEPDVVLVRAEAKFCVESGRGWLFDHPRAVEVKVSRWRWLELLKEEEEGVAFGVWSFGPDGATDNVEFVGDASDASEVGYDA